MYVTYVVYIEIYFICKYFTWILKFVSEFGLSCKPFHGIARFYVVKENRLISIQSAWRSSAVYAIHVLGKCSFATNKP
jgi:hypothetical protein